jgi:hypothetical protein
MTWKGCVPAALPAHLRWRSGSRQKEVSLDDPIPLPSTAEHPLFHDGRARDYPHEQGLRYCWNDDAFLVLTTRQDLDEDVIGRLGTLLSE